MSCLKQVLAGKNPTLDRPNISGTKCDRDKPFFSTERGVNQFVMRHKIRTQLDKKKSKMGVIIMDPPYHTQVLEVSSLVSTVNLYIIHLPFLLPSDNLVWQFQRPQMG